MKKFLKLKDYGRNDKIRWHIFFKYKDKKFMIRDYKFETWSIECQENDPKTKELTKEIIKKIIASSKIINKSLIEKLRFKSKNENFFLNNNNSKLTYLYSYYKSKILEIIDTIETITESLDIIKDIKIHFKKISQIKEKEKLILAYAFPFLLSFFSYLEFILDSFFSFNKKGITYFEFSEKEWDKKFKFVFDLTKNKELKKIYEEILKIKKNYRNPLTHGLTDKEKSILIPIDNFGLVPFSFEYLSETVYYGSNSVKINDILKITKTFDDFFRIIGEKSPYRYFKLFIDYEFPIPMGEPKISELKEKMSDFKTFKIFLDDLKKYETNLINRDI